MIQTFFQYVRYKPIAAFRAVTPVIRRLRKQAWLVKGLKTGNHHNMCVAFYGDEVDRHFWAKLVFGDEYQEIPIGKIWLWQFLNLSKYHSEEISLTVADIPGFMFRLMGAKEDFYIPLWVFGVVDLTSFAEMLARPKAYSNLGAEIRRIKKSQFQYETSLKDEDFKEFYYDFYHPFISQRWGNRAYLGGYELRHRAFEKGELLFVKKDGRRISCLLLTYYNGKAEFIALGIKQDGTDYVHMGAISALYYFGLKHLVAKGYQKVNLGGSRAFLNDGVLRYKKKWGLNITTGGWLGFILRIRKLDDAVNTWLINNPFIFQDGDSLCGAVFIPTEQSLEEETMSKILKQSQYPGLNTIQIYSTNSKKVCRPLITLTPQKESLTYHARDSTRLRDS